MSPSSDVSITTPPDVPSIENGDSSEDPTTPKAKPIVPGLVLPRNNVSSLMPPPTITRPLLNNTTSSALSPSISTLPLSKRPRQKVVLAPGHSSLDWARLKSSGTDLRVTPSNGTTLTARKQIHPFY